MRVSDYRHMENWLREVQRTAEKVERAEIMSSTGKSLLRLSDNPSGFSRAVAFKEQINKQDQYITAIDDGIAWLETTETALASVSDILSSAQEMSLMGANGTISADEQNVLAQQVEQMIEQMIALANSQHAGKYIFSGEQTNTKPFALNAAADAVVYSGDSGSICRQMQYEDTVSINCSGSQAFIDTGVFEAMFKLKEALESGDQEKVGTAVPMITQAFEEVVSQRALAGNKINQAEAVKERQEQQKNHFKSILGDIEEADLTEAITNLKMEETAYQAALLVGSSIMETSLLDFLR